MQNPSTTLCLTEAKKKGWKLAWLQIYFLNLKTWPFFTDLKLPGKFSNPLAKARKVPFWGAKTLKATLMVNSLTKMKAMTSAIFSGIFQLWNLKVSFWQYWNVLEFFRQSQSYNAKSYFLLCPRFSNFQLCAFCAFLQFSSVFQFFEFCQLFFTFVQFYRIFQFFWILSN